MATPQSIIIQAFFDLGAIAVGETPTDAELADGLVRLNQMVATWSTEGASVFNRVLQSFALQAGVAAYTLGVAGTFATTGGLRAQKITAWRATYQQMVKGGEPLAMEDFARAASQAQQALAALATQAALEGLVPIVPSPLVTPIPTLVGADTAWPLLNVRVWPPPSASPGSIELAYWTPIARFAALDATVSLPDGYEDALHFNLAIRLAPQYARQSGVDPALAANAQNSKLSLVQWNTMGPPPAEPKQPQQQQ